MLRRKISSNERDDVEINLSPMIDMVFILLIFHSYYSFVEETELKKTRSFCFSTIREK